MNIGMTVYNNHSIDDSNQATVPLPVSNSRGATLNPEASVFRLPAQQSISTTTDAVDGEPKQKQVHLFMNGDVGKEVCGEQCPPTEPLCQKTSSEKDMSSSSENVFGSTSPTEKMTEAIALPKEMQKEEMLSTESNSIGECDVMNGTAKEMDVDKVDDDSQEDKNDTGQERENLDDASQSAIPAAQAEKVSSEPLTREQIKELLGQNIEFFFSRENWSSDPYLCSQMDNDQYVPVFILANCSQFKSITKDHSIIMEALKDSVFVQLDEENNRVRPNYQRCIVILREIPRSTPVEDIQAMFKGEGCPKVINCEFVHNDFWYVTFDSDSDAQKAYRYLRETVKTFKDKPILARIKTKPMSRLRCPSVLPSCKTPGGESREGSVAMQGSGNVNSAATPGVAPPGPSGIQGLPTPHPPPNSYPNNSQRMYFAPQNINNPGYHNYNFTGSAAQIPAAYFYPNPIMHAQWNNPSGNFYDINSFIQYNGLSPRAAFKPPPNTRFTNSNGNATRRTKNREPKFDKNEPRHLSSASNGGGSGVGSQLRHNQSTSRPQSAQSPQLCNQAATPNSNLHHSLASSQIPAVQLSHHLPKGESQPNFNTILTSSINNNSNVVHTSHNSFAQNDISLTSQSNLYTSFSSPAGINIPRGNNNTIKVEKPEKEELGSHAAIESTEVSNFEGSCSENSEIVVSIAPDTLNAVASGSSTSNISTTSSSVVTNSINSNQQIPAINQQLPHHHHYHQTMPVSHRCSFNNETHIPSREQPQRQMSRGGRRRVPRRDEDTNGHTGSGNGRGSQRGAAAQNINGELQSKTAEVKKPFELQSVSFPPLPSADEVVASPPEEKVVESSQVAWSGEPHKFSDVMKGTAKPKHFTTPSSVPTTEKEPVVDVVTPPQSTVSVAELNGKPSEENVPSPNLEISPIENTNHNNNNCTVNTSSNNIISGNNSISSTISSKNSSESSQVVTTNVVRQERPPSVREDRRPAGMQVIRREREFIPGIGRGGSSRRERDAGNFRTSGNKENRPQTGSNRSWREERADPDGWITKGPRETRAHRDRDHRFQSQHSGQHNYYESRNFNSKSQTIVNGDASPPPPPKPETTPKPSEISSNKSSATTTNCIKNFSKQESKPVKSEVMDEKVKDDGNNDGEHKTSWAKMALASKDKMEQLSAKLKEKEEQERMKKRTTKSTQKVPERISVGREREGKPFRRENFSPREREKELTEKGGSREFRGGPERTAPFGFKPREALRPKSPK